MLEKNNHFFSKITEAFKISEFVEIFMFYHRIQRNDIKTTRNRLNVTYLTFNIVEQSLNIATEKLLKCIMMKEFFYFKVLTNISIEKSLFGCI